MKYTSREEERQALVTGKVVSVEPLADKLKRDAAAMKRGRKDKSGVLSGIQPEREEWSDIRGRIIYGTSEWRIVRLRQLIGDGSKLPDDYLTARKAEWQSIAAKKRYVLLDKIDSLWNTFSAQFGRAVLRSFAR